MRGTERKGVGQQEARREDSSRGKKERTMATILISITQILVHLKLYMHIVQLK